MKVYRVKDWGLHFENNRTKEIKKLAWVPFPNKHDGDGYTELLDHPRGFIHFGAWCAIVQVASKCGPRGTLLRDTAAPHTAATIARMTRFPVDVISEAIDRLVSMQWLETYEYPAVSCGDTAVSCLEQNRTEQNRNEQNGTTTTTEGETGGGKYSDFIKRLKSIKPEFRKFQDFQWVDAMKLAYGRMDIIELAVTAFEKDIINRVNLPEKPTALFAGFVKGTIRKHLTGRDLFDFCKANNLDYTMFASKGQ